MTPDDIDIDLTPAQAKKRIPQFVTDRQVLIKRLERFKAFVGALDQNDPTDLVQLASRTEAIKKDAIAFEHLQKSLERFDLETPSDHPPIRESYEDTFWKYSATADYILQSLAPPPAGASVAPAVSARETHVKLPPLHLPKFSGENKEDWSAFSATFRSSVHDAPSFTDAQRLLYLRTCLTGRAFDKIESIPITPSNYKVAWDLLVENYFDFASVVNGHVRSLFELPQCSKPCSSELDVLLSQASKHYKALEALGSSFLHAFPVYAVTSKLDSQTRVKWMEDCLKNKSPTMAELLDFLADRKKVLSSSETAPPKKTEPEEHKPHSNSLHKSHKPPAPPEIKSVAYNAQVKPPLCSICKESHHTYSCERLLKASPRERYDAVKAAKLCINCLRSDHGLLDCATKSRCRTCNKAHHSLLHFEERAPNQSPSFSGVTFTSRVTRFSNRQA